MYETAKTVIIVIGICAIAFVAGLLVGRGQDKDFIDRMQAEITTAETANTGLRAKLKASQREIDKLRSDYRELENTINASISLSSGIGNLNQELTSLVEQIQELLDSPDNN